MAGNYPDLPAPRIEYDRDGSRVYHIVGSTVTELTPAQVATINDENRDSKLDNLNYNYFSVLFVFPELRDVTHAFIEMMGDPKVVHLDWSNDSTTGVDGTWTKAVADFPESNNTTTRYRSDIVATPGIAGVRMVKVVVDSAYFNSMPTIHLYGKVSAGQNLHRLRLWHPTLDEPLDNYPAHLDWGNVPQNSTDTRQFRVKNDSPNLGASGIKVFVDALYPGNPSQISQHQLSLDGATFVASAKPGVTVPPLTAQAISNPVYLRRNTLITAQLGLWRQRVVAAADTWA